MKNIIQYLDADDSIILLKIYEKFWDSYPSTIWLTVKRNLKLSTKKYLQRILLVNILNKLKKLKNYQLGWDRYNKKDIIQFKYTIYVIIYICEDYNKNLKWINNRLNINQETRSYQRIHGELNKFTSARDIRFCIHLTLLERLDDSQKSDYQFVIAHPNYFDRYIKCNVTSSFQQKGKTICNHCHNIMHEDKKTFHFHANNEELLKTLLE